jgi:hypothetical protein
MKAVKEPKVAEENRREEGRGNGTARGRAKPISVTLASTVQLGGGDLKDITSSVQVVAETRLRLGSPKNGEHLTAELDVFSTEVSSSWERGPEKNSKSVSRYAASSLVKPSSSSSPRVVMTAVVTEAVVPVQFPFSFTILLPPRAVTSSGQTVRPRSVHVSRLSSRPCAVVFVRSQRLRDGVMEEVTVQAEVALCPHQRNSHNARSLARVQ